MLNSRRSINAIFNFYRTGRPVMTKGPENEQKALALTRIHLRVWFEK